MVNGRSTQAGSTQQAAAQAVSLAIAAHPLANAEFNQQPRRCLYQAYYLGPNRPIEDGQTAIRRIR